jgi:mannose/cellobiose epimerase-like protein (N-acyl-D-glucosamine 2-epimerase family)
MTRRIDFTFSDLIAGYVTGFDQSRDSFSLVTSDGRDFDVRLSANVYAELVRNLGEPFHDATGQLRSLLVPGRFLYAYGVFYPDGKDGSYLFDAKHIVILGRSENEFAFERSDWWMRQIHELGDFFLKAEFPEGVYDYREYRTSLSDMGGKLGSARQEADTISRLVYGFASAFMLTGEDRFLEAADAGTKYLRDYFRVVDANQNVTYWYHAIDVVDAKTDQKIFASEFGDDYDAIPCYEQIYALAGPVQTYRITGDPAILADAEGTIRLFDTFFKDKSEQGGYFSHLDPVTFDPRSPSLGHNQARKNWNSVGDHAPAYLINLWLATGNNAYANFLEYTFDTIAERFPDYENSPFVQEKFFADWSKDQSWGWQQNRAVVGHNLKIAWNLTRMHNLKPKEGYESLARKIAALMPAAGSDGQRGGWYDVVERTLEPGQKYHRFAWHDRKAWWQQEQAILAYLILNGTFGDGVYLKYARESAAFYNAWFLDTTVGGVYFNVLANGHPYELGTERGKGSHSMSGYHSFELAYLGAVYTNLLVTRQPLNLWFKPKKGGFKDGILRVSPDILPPGSVRIESVTIDGAPYADFDADGLFVRLPADHGDIKVHVQLVPTTIALTAEFGGIEDAMARIAVSGDLSPNTMRHLNDAIEAALSAGAAGIRFDVTGLTSMSSEAVRAILMLKQHRGPAFRLEFHGASPAIRAVLVSSDISDEALVG